jgi:NADPH2:quinone reductase
VKVIQLRAPGGPEVLELAERPMPEPAAGEVRVRATAIGISSADMLIRKGIYNWMPPLPAVPGNEMAGTIDALGANVSGVKLGQKVLVSSRELEHRGGCYAQAICVQASALYPLPDTVSPHDAVTLPNYQLAGALLYESGVRKPASILIHGASGGVATAVMQLAAADGIEAIGTVSTEEKRAFALAAGAAHIVLRGREDVAEAVMRVTQARGVDVVYAGAGPTFTRNLDLLAPLGTLVSYNILGGLIPEADIYGEIRKRIGKSLGVRCYSIHTLDTQPVLRRALMQRAIDLMGAGKLKPPPPMLLPLADARRAHELMEAAQTLGKVVLLPD